MPDSTACADLPIGLFDSGVGGLTVLAALRGRLPAERYCYLGDTARLPYGTKSRSTIERYALQAARKLVERTIKLLVVACNTATAAALPSLREACAPLPVIGVIEPGALAACKTLAAKGGRGTVLVLGTESTIRGEAYTRAIHALQPEATIIGVSCTLFVPLAEEGWTSGPIAESIARRYLSPALRDAAGKHLAAFAPGNTRDNRDGIQPDCIVLGCTHFPPLRGAIASVVGQDVPLVDSAETTAEAVEEALRERNLLRVATPSLTRAPSDIGHLRLLTTDAPERFARVGALFLGCPINPQDLELVAL